MPAVLHDQRCRSARSATTPMSWVISRIAASMRSRRSRISSRISACTVTSSAVVGSSAISELRVAGERLRDHRALPLAAGELVRVGVDTPFRVRDLDQLEQLDGALWRALARRHRVVDAQRLDDLETDRVHRVQRRHRLLEDDRDLVAAHVAQLSGVGSRPVRGRPSLIDSRTRPFCGSRPSSAIGLVVLPEPDSPTIARTSPGFSVEVQPTAAGYQVPSTQKSMSRSDGRSTGT